MERRLCVPMKLVMKEALHGHIKAGTKPAQTDDINHKKETLTGWIKNCMCALIYCLGSKIFL